MPYSTDGVHPKALREWYPNARPVNIYNSAEFNLEKLLGSPGSGVVFPDVFSPQPGRPPEVPPPAYSGKVSSMNRLALSVSVVTLAMFAGIASALQDVQSPAPVESPAPKAVAAAETWQGDIDVLGQKLGVIVRFEGSGDGLAGAMDIPAQGVNGLKLKDISRSPSSMAFTFEFPGAPTAVFTLKLEEADPSSAVGTMSQAGQSFPVAMKKLADGEAPKGPERPQHPVPPFPYQALDVSFPGGAEGVTLAGTLTISAGEGPFPAAVLVSGSGPQDRDETLLGHKPFLVLADALTKAGVAVLRYDDRGVGASTGDFQTGTTDDFANDAEKAAAFMRARPDIDPKRIGIIGHSEGGLIAPIVAARNDSIAFLVLLAGPGTDGKQVLGDQIGAILRSVGVPEAAITKQVKVQQKMLSKLLAGAPREELVTLMKTLIALQSGVEEPTPEQLAAAAPDDMVNAQIESFSSPWMRRFLEIDPRDSLRRVKVPVLALNGTKDTQVIASINLPEIEKALATAGNQDITCLGVNGLNHLFQTSESGSPQEYASISETFAPAALQKVTSWVRQRTGLEPMPPKPQVPGAPASTPKADPKQGD